MIGKGIFTNYQLCAHPTFNEMVPNVNTDAWYNKLSCYIRGTDFISRSRNVASPPGKGSHRQHNFGKTSFIAGERKISPNSLNNLFYQGAEKSKS